MILHGNPNNWSCLPTAFAMVAGWTPATMISTIGHDGSDEPYAEEGLKTGFHEQECIEVLQRGGYACTPIEIGPTISPHLDGHEARKVYFNGRLEGNWVRLRRHMREASGVITGMYTNDGKTAGHAVAWDHITKMVYDPNFNGRVYRFKSANFFGFTPGCFWKVQNVKHG